jgi:two-component system OmpR family response regulator
VRVVSTSAAGAGPEWRPMRPVSVLITEDDPFTRQLLAACFEKAGYHVEQAETGREMHDKLASRPVDLVLLDINLPDEDGLVLLRQIRARSSVPVVVLSVRGDEADRIAGLELGADDYVPKSWSPRELMARVARVIGRSRGGTAGDTDEANRYLTFASFRLDTMGHTLLNGDGADVPLTAAEFRLLLALARAKGRTLTRDQLLDALGSGADSPYDRTVDVLISRLRKKLDPVGAPPGLIRTVPGIGYQLIDR